MKYTRLLITVVAAVCLCACGDDKEEWPGSFALEVNEIGILEGISSATVKITGGSKNYEVKVADPAIATAEVVYGESYEYGAVKVTGKTEGATTVTVTDRLLGQQEKLEVLVSEPGVLLWLDYLVPEIKGVGEETEKLIAEDMQKTLLFGYDYEYILSREERGIFYSYDREGGVERRFCHHTADGSIYLEITATDGDDAEVRALRLIEETSEAIFYYKSFFELHTVASRASMPSQREPAVYFSEDLTDRYREVFPDKGLTSAVVFYRMVFGYAAFDTRYPGN
ncbi:MAG: pilus assembly protein N-terminal domain-containing protein [Rikenellaceae bacterium]|nr:pilus assembly protein N-terminal domain-containing protein [Rikenellaceae bacterium]